MGYLPGMWHDFGVTIGGLAGALTGLLFVAVSIKSDTLAKSRQPQLPRRPDPRAVHDVGARRYQSSWRPSPSTRSAGSWSRSPLVSGATLYVLDRRGGHDQTSRVARYIERASPNAITQVLFGVAGLTFLITAGGGLYWLIPAAVTSLVGGVINAWLFLVRA